MSSLQKSAKVLLIISKSRCTQLAISLQAAQRRRQNRKNPLPDSYQRNAKELLRQLFFYGFLCFVMSQ
jgi:hypothetical protein